MKTLPTKKLALDVQTLRTLTGDTLDSVAGGQAQGIVSTDTPSFCIKNAPLCQKPRNEPKC